MSTKKTDKATELVTSERARAHGLKRIPRRHPAPHGGIPLSECKVRITMFVDADVLEHFKERARQPDAAPYQTQMNNELRRAMKHEASTNSSNVTAMSLVEDPNFINEVAAKVARLRRQTKAPDALPDVVVKNTRAGKRA